MKKRCAPATEADLEKLADRYVDEDDYTIECEDADDTGLLAACRGQRFGDFELLS